MGLLSPTLTLKSNEEIPGFMEKEKRRSRDRRFSEITRIQF